MQTYDYQLLTDQNIISMVEEGTIFLDIETTGLKKETSLIELIGCGYYDKNERENPLHIIQWFNDDAVSEEEILQSFLHFLGEHPGPLLTFNGDGFDLPFLTAHMEYNELSLPWSLALENHPSLDLFKILRGFAPLLGLANGKQKSWESLIGIHRKDKFDGGKLIPVYKNYLKSKKNEDLEKILLHNMEDVKGLSQLSVCLAYEQLRSGDYSIIGIEESEEESICFNLQLKDSCPSLIQSVGQNEKQASNQPDLQLEKCLTGTFSMTSSNFCKLVVPYKSQKMYHFYSNYQDYYYLPLEDRAIHKSIGAYVDKEHRQKATQKNCYIPLESLFFPLPKKACAHGFSIIDYNEYKTTLYKESYDTNRFYISFEDLFHDGEVGSLTKMYIHNMIQAIFLNHIRS